MQLLYRDLVPKITIEGQSFYPSLVPVEILYTGAEIYHKVNSVEEYRLDIISYKYYDTPHYWRIIAYHNKIKDPIFEIVRGRLLIIPTDLLDYQRLLR